LALACVRVGAIAGFRQRMPKKEATASGCASTGTHDHHSAASTTATTASCDDHPARDCSGDERAKPRHRRTKTIALAS